VRLNEGREVRAPHLEVIAWIMPLSTSPECDDTIQVRNPFDG
jgi:hypothetical protein